MLSQFPNISCWKCLYLCMAAKYFIFSKNVLVFPLSCLVFFLQTKSIFFVFRFFKYDDLKSLLKHFGDILHALLYFI